MASLKYTGPKLTSSERQRLLGDSKRDTQLQYSGQSDALSSRRQLEAGQSRLIDQAYNDYRAQIANQVRMRQAGLGQAQGMQGDLIQASNAGMADLAGNQDAEAARMNAITGGTANSNDAFRQAMLRSVNQSNVNAGAARTAGANVDGRYDMNLAGVGEQARGAYKQKSQDRLAGLDAEGRGLQRDMGLASKKRFDELTQQAFERWKAKEQVKLANREVNVSDAANTADRESEERQNTQDNQTSSDNNKRTNKGDGGGSSGSGADGMPGGMTAANKAKWTQANKTYKDAYNSVRVMVASGRYGRGKSIDWKTIKLASGITNKSIWYVVKDLKYPGLRGLSSGGRSRARGSFVGGNLPSWMTDKNR